MKPIANGGAAATETLRRPQIREILKRHKGSYSRLGERLGVTYVHVSLVLKGKSTSKRVMDAATELALQLLQQEQEARS